MSKIKLQAGSALEGGVMFATKNNYAIARYQRPSKFEQLKAKVAGKEIDEGELEVVSGKVDPPVGGYILSKIPFVAGIVALITGIFCRNDREPWKTIRGDAPTIAKLGAIVIIGLVLAVLGGFSYWVGSWIAGLLGIPVGTYWHGFILSFAMPFASLLSIILSAHFLQTDMLNFHGAEHKVGNALRKGLEITKENVEKQSRIHTNCSTNFVVNCSIAYPFIIALLYMWLGSFALALVVGFPVCAAINVELLRFSTLIGENPISYVFNFFGLLAQRITVREPEEKHVVAAMAAMNKVLELERGKTD